MKNHEVARKHLGVKIIRSQATFEMTNQDETGTRL